MDTESQGQPSAKIKSLTVVNSFFVVKKGFFNLHKKHLFRQLPTVLNYSCAFQNRFWDISSFEKIFLCLCAMTIILKIEDDEGSTKPELNAADCSSSDFAKASQ